VDDLATIPTPLLKERITTLSPERMAQVETAIRFALDL
jgi:mRNA-degrading endonuclease toxin of MazEF toxin-antitoxin module